MIIFSAIPLPEAIKNKVAVITRGKLPVPYVNTENLHITLNYFGELDTDQVARVKTVFAQATANYKKFSIEFDQIVKFHHQLHLTVKSSQALTSLHDRLKDEFEHLGFRSGQEFYAHVKLANMHMDNVMNRQRKMENFPHEELAQLNFEAEKIALYESKLLLHHPKYIPLLEQTLI
jgi:2'-5' RNA ligase